MKGQVTLSCTERALPGSPVQRSPMGLFLCCLSWGPLLGLCSLGLGKTGLHCYGLYDIGSSFGSWGEYCLIHGASRMNQGGPQPGRGTPYSCPGTRHPISM